MNTPDGFALACKHCGHIPPADLELGDVQVHFVVEHGTVEVELELCWIGQPRPCPDERWSQCPVDSLCYRGEAHGGDCWLPKW